jgi:hypothetical protein
MLETNFSQGVDFATKLIQVDDMLLRLQFWDISGGVSLTFIAISYYYPEFPLLLTNLFPSF